MWIVRRKKEEDGEGEDMLMRKDHRLAIRVVTLVERIRCSTLDSTKKSSIATKLRGFE